MGVEDESGGHFDSIWIILEMEDREDAESREVRWCMGD